jgi:hypothetical protein
VYEEHPFLPLGALKASGEPRLGHEYKYDKVARSSVSVDGAQGDVCQQNSRPVFKLFASTEVLPSTG